MFAAGTDVSGDQTLGMLAPGKHHSAELHSFRGRHEFVQLTLFTFLANPGASTEAVDVILPESDPQLRLSSQVDRQMRRSACMQPS